MFKEKFRKIDFLIPLIIGFLLAWWSFGRGEYVGVAICFIFSLVGANARWKWGHGTEEFRKKCKEESIKRQMEQEEINKGLGNYSTHGPFVLDQVGGAIGGILLTLYLLILNSIRHDYLKCLILLGIEFFFITILLFALTKHKKYWKPTIIRLVLLVSYFAILFLIFYK